jgi:hypothetical protein
VSGHMDSRVVCLGYDWGSTPVAGTQGPLPFVAVVVEMALLRSSIWGGVLGLPPLHRQLLDPSPMCVPSIAK